MNKAVYLLIITFILFTGCDKFTRHDKSIFVKNQGFIFGTMYNLSYESLHGKDYEPQIQLILKEFEKSLSPYDSTSIISKINNNKPDVITDTYFENCFNKSKKIAKITNGAFDITVAPIVNAWGFGFKNIENTDSSLIAKLMPFVGYEKVSLQNHQVIKNNPKIMLDVSAIAKGYGVDVTSEYLESKGIKNYMVEIGGEVRVKGVNQNGEFWKIGIEKPIEDNLDYNRKIQTIIKLKNRSLATSGNYRQFYEKDGIKYSHTIDPRTGFPSRNNLLSASVLANDCMTADAFATAFMVLGLEKTKELVNQIENLDVFLIYTDSKNSFKTYSSKSFK